MTSHRKLVIRLIHLLFFKNETGRNVNTVARRRWVLPVGRGEGLLLMSRWLLHEAQKSNHRGSFDGRGQFL